MKAKILKRFNMSGVYRVAFKVRKPGYAGPLSLEITAPRDGFGRRLMSSDHVVRPRAQTTLRVDSAGNRWLCVDYPMVKHGQVMKFHFGFKYQVDMGRLLDRDVLVAAGDPSKPLPKEVMEFVKQGYKIDPSLPQARAWAARGAAGPVEAKKEVTRLTKFLKRAVTYDDRKRQEYFGGRKTYSDVDDMYETPAVTLARGSGCCPDTVLVECSFYRALGLPCRTAGRFGHFFTMVYVAGRGWMSTSVTPTGIPLVLAPGPDHLPYQRWTPRIPLRTTLWEARMRIDTVED
jgi:hypothetical protein